MMMMEENDEDAGEEGEEDLETTEGKEEGIMVKEGVGAATIRFRNRPKKEV